MARRGPAASWAALLSRQASQLTRSTLRQGARSMARAAEPLRAQRVPPPGAGEWLAGIVVGPTGPRRYRLFRPAGVRFGERLPLLVMLHGCGQDAKRFAASTRMNVVAARERFLVLYPEQDRLSNPKGCWNWFETRSGRAQAEAGSVLLAIDQVCLLYAADRSRVALAGLSAGASLASLLAVRHPERFRAVVMHSGIPPGTADSTLSAVGAMHGYGTAPQTLAALPAAGTWPALLVIHGSADGVVAAANGRAAVRLWADAAGARAGVPRVVKRGARHPMTITEHRCGGRTVATLVEVERLGHAWSGGAASEEFGDRHGPDASRMTWAFAARQFAAGAAEPAVRPTRRPASRIRNDEPA